MYLPKEQTQSQVSPFSFEGHNVRVHLDENGTTWWIASDVCQILGISKVSDAVMRLESDEKRDLMSIGEIGTSLIINESGLYRLIFRSNKPDAKRFQKWVFSEVLPQIRKTGRYESPAVVQPPSIPDRIAAMRAFLELGEEYGLTDDLTRMLAREAIQNGLREVANPYATSRLQLPAPSVASQYFTIESLREEFGELTAKQWATHRGTFGKVCRLAIQAADPECEPQKVTKYVNGEERPVNMWPIQYRDIAIAAIESHIRKLVEK